MMVVMVAVGRWGDTRNIKKQEIKDLSLKDVRIQQEDGHPQTRRRTLTRYPICWHLFFFFFLQLYLWHMEVPRLGVE